MARSTWCCASRTPPGSDQHRYVVVDYKTNKLGDPERPLTALDYTPALMTEAMLHSHYPLQALLYSVVLHRYLRWRLADYDPERHLGGILYLYVRGMCGPETPEVDGQPCGVFAWHPPAAMVLELSDLLSGEVVLPVIDDRHDRRLALRAPGLLATFNRADVLSAADVHVAARLGAMTEETDEQVLLATALAVRAVRQGSTCLDLTTVADVPLEDETDAQEVLPWPEPEAWQAAVAASPLVRLEVLRFDNALLYLDRYWREEVQVCRDVVAASTGRRPRSTPRSSTPVCCGSSPRTGTRSSATPSGRPPGAGPPC